jgi:hypothetical protein
MGWRGRAFHIEDATAAAVYDSAGNGRPTAWWDGRIVGGWAQHADGAVVIRPLTDLPDAAATALQHEADKLTGWLDGQVLRSNLKTPLG